MRLLINPETRTLAIEVCDQDDPRKHRVPGHVMNSKQCYEINSTTLCDQLQLHTNWKTGCAYKLFAAAQAGEKLILFKLDDAILSSGGILMTTPIGKQKNEA